MRIALIDVDSHNFPNLPLMKLSAWHKQQGDSVEWYEPLFHSMREPFDKAYMSKVFSFTPDYPYHVNAKEVHKGGSGYCIRLVGGKEVYDAEKDTMLPPEIETIYPDYEIYCDKIPEVRNTAYGFLTRGCPRGCEFCHVGCKEGSKSYKAADLDTFWSGQKNIVLLDPNITACKDWKELFQQLIDSKAWIDISQGLDIRMMTEEKVEMLKQMRIKQVHFAWDRYEDKEIIVPKFKMFAELTGWGYWKMTVYVLCNFNTTFEQDLERIYTLRDLGYSPYVMLYDKEHIPDGHKLRKLQRYVCGRQIFRTCKSFEDYQKKEVIKPDIVGDFRNIPFDEDTFHMVVFDPPHLLKAGDSSWLAKKYGKLSESWPEDLKQGFSECMRVLKPYGTLIFKWNEQQIKLSKILKVIEYEPLFGNKRSDTHWLVFMKESEVV